EHQTHAPHQPGHQEGRQLDREDQGRGQAADGGNRRARLRGQTDRDLEPRGRLPREVDGPVTRHRRQPDCNGNAGTRPQRIPELSEKMSKMVRAKLQAADGAGSLEFTFNPTEYSVTKSAKWQTPPRNMKEKAGAKPEYLGSEPQTISMQIFFD